MNEKSQATVDVLNRLYGAETHTMLPRLMNLSLVVSRRCPLEGTLFARIAQLSQEHREWLITEIERHRGSVTPVTLDIHSASSHYVSSSAIRPQVQRNLAELIQAYSGASSEKNLEPSARDLVRRIGRRYEGLLDEIERSIAKPDPVPPATVVGPAT
jgi:hypothetical protein